ncbi:MAG: CHRD domain-containing protein [Methylobacter sp.]|uniref:CHRD domain-containing protein n=1 Tax=Methylobacter sp. TaxID=2051955 RepID=UPI002586450F|nr:CHRD domain-containing protein [Methylobacter sp.]MCL7420512.1 CHRD domain-containing protein [Methylobacter sp.]
MKKILVFITLATTLLFAAPFSHAALVKFNADLDGPSEFPVNNSPGTGFSSVDFDTIANTLRVQIEFADLLGTTVAAHIHCCVSQFAQPSTAGVATAVPSFPGFPSGVTAGTYDEVFDLTLASSFNPAFITANGGTVAGAAAALTEGMLAGESYVNIHTTEFPAGEIRGFLQVEQVPEPELAGLLGLGLGSLLVLRRRKHIALF